MMNRVINRSKNTFARLFNGIWARVFVLIVGFGLVGSGILLSQNGTFHQQLVEETAVVLDAAKEPSTATEEDLSTTETTDNTGEAPVIEQANDDVQGEYSQQSSSYRSLATTSRSTNPLRDVCPGNFFPPDDLRRGEQWTMPMPETKVLPSQTMRLAPGQTTVAYLLPIPEALSIAFISDNNSSIGSQRNLQLAVGAHHITAHTICYDYVVDVTVLLPELKILSVNYLAGTNSIEYSMNTTADYLNVVYEIIGCQSPDYAVCGGQHTTYLSSASGTIELDPLFPEIDAYFLEYGADEVRLSIVPYRQNFEVTEYGYLSFTL